MWLSGSVEFIFIYIVSVKIIIFSRCFTESQGMIPPTSNSGRDYSLLTGNSLEQNQAHMAGPPADCWLDKAGGEGGGRTDIEENGHTSKYINYTEESKLDPSWAGWQVSAQLWNQRYL